ncbi:MAG: hypothetical protein HY235_06660 [Acidobacteria bacterium]|nr:hypothetical protein [Acidobacteriota bacterium]
MKRPCILFVLVLTASAGLRGQLTSNQKALDMEHLASLYAKNYGPYEWKRDFVGFDLLDLASWLSRALATKDDLEFYELMAEYVRRLDDAHDGYLLPSNFVARLHFTVDNYDGRVLVDSINRLRLPATEFPFRTGYEVLSVDGRSSEDLIREYSRFLTGGNPRTTRRLAANLITVRPQSVLPRAIEIGDMATVVMRRFDGTTETFRIPWSKAGLPLRTVGPVPTPADSTVAIRQAERVANWESEYLALLERLQRVEVPHRTVLGVGARNPVFLPPDEFLQRLGRAPADFFYSGVFEAGGYRIGFVRIPSFSPPNAGLALQQFAAEVAFFQANTNGLIIDTMRNPGGFVSFTNSLLQYVIPREFRTVGFELRATSSWVVAISSSLESARAQGAPPFVISQLEFLRDQIVTANREFRGRTLAIPLDDVTLDRDPARDSRGSLAAYTKPLMLLVDEMTASGGDMFAATIQDNQRGLLFGMRTMGAGGSVSGYAAGVYSEGFTSLTESLMIRSAKVQPAGYPASSYIENVGVHPDIEADYMTRDNLILDGRLFVRQFVDAMVDHIRRSR